MICLEPDYMKDFACDGKRCGSQCCKGWAIFVDRVTYNRYLGLPEDLREEILPKVVESEEGEEEPYRLNFGSNEVCPFLRGDSLCNLQKKFGEGYLGNTCALYPRKSVIIGDKLQRSLSLSCPMASELVIFRDTPVKFETEEISAPERLPGWQKVATGKEETGVALACLLLQETCLSILERDISISERLSLIVGFLSEADRAVEAADFELLAEIIRLYRNSGGKGEEGLPIELSQAFPGLSEKLKEAEKENFRLRGLRPIESDGLLPAFDMLLSNVLKAEFFLELFPCTFDGTLRHNGLAFYAVALLYRETLLPLYDSGDAAGVWLSVQRLSILLGHDKMWRKILSEEIGRGR